MAATAGENLNEPEPEQNNSKQQSTGKTVNEPKTEQNSGKQQTTPVVPTYLEIAANVENIMRPHVDTIKSLYPDAEVGYRGSLATGIKIDKNGKPTDFVATDYDVDGFIVSDVLASKFSKARYFRSARDINELKSTCIEIEQSLSGLPGYRIDPKKPFTFKVFTTLEFQTKVVPKGYKILSK